MTTHRLAAALLFALVLSTISSAASAQVLVVESRIAPASSVLVAPAPPSPTPEIEAAPRERPVWRAVAAGAGILGGAWALNVVGSGLWMLAPTGATGPDLLVPTWNGHPSDFFNWSLVPIVGPFVQMAYAEHPEWQLPILAIDGLLQVAGLVTAIAGQCARESVRSRGPSLAVMPAASSQLVGLVVSGSF